MPLRIPRESSSWKDTIIAHVMGTDCAGIGAGNALLDFVSTMLTAAEPCKA